MNDNSARVLEVDINEILPNRFQPRIQFDEDEILELSDSIKEHGVIQPIVVRTVGDKYEIIAGERRYKASVLAGNETVPVIVKNLNDKESAEIALIENVQRKNLTPIEEAISYKKILDMGYLTQEQLATKIGKSQPAVANKIRLLNLSDEVQEALLENRISERHARSLLKLPELTQQNKLLNRIIEERLTVRKTDEEIEKLKLNKQEIDNKKEEPKLEQEENINDIFKRIIEEGERKMNNNEVMNSSIQSPSSTPTTSDFDIFGTPVSAPVVPEMPTMVEPVSAPVVPEMPTMAEPVSAPVMPEMPTMAEPVSAPVVPEMPTMAEPVSAPVVPEMPTMAEPVSAPVMPEMPTMAEPVSAPVMPEMPTMAEPVQPTFVVPTIPQMSPIIENPVSTPEPTPAPIVATPSVVPEMPTTQEPVSVPTMPEPIIVTDYSKQYDPVMNVPELEPTPVVDFKEVISAIRECSSKIEKFGFKIDVEEYDLTNLYQVIFKIEK